MRELAWLGFFLIKPSLFDLQIVYSVDVEVKPSKTSVTCTCVKVIISLVAEITCHPSIGSSRDAGP